MTLRHIFLPTLAVLFVAALAIRLEVCRELLALDVQVSRPSAATDMSTYKLMSEQILSGEYSGEFYYQPFYYAVFLTTVKRLFGLGPWPVMVAQSLLSALTVWLAGLTAARLWGRLAGLTAGTLCAFSAMLIFYSPYHLLEILQAFWVALIACLAVTALHKGTWQRWTALGMVVGMAILTRGNLWLFVPGLLAAALWREWTPTAAAALARHAPEARRGRWQAAGLAAVLLLVAILAVQLPFAWKNTQLRGRLSGPSTAAGAVLGLGNTPEAPPGGREPGAGPGPMEYPRTYQAWGEEVAQVGVFTRILRWAWREPAAFAELQWRKLLLYWDAGEIPNNIAWEHQGIRSPTLLRFGFATTGLMMALALTLAMPLSLHAMRRMRHSPRTALAAHPGRNLLLYLLVAYWLATAAFYILARFRVPSIPLFAMFAGGAVGVTALRIRRHDWTALVRKTLPAAIASLALVYLGYDLYRHQFEASVLRRARPDGTRTELAAGRILILDHGPMPFGSWRPVPVTEELTVEKRLILAPGDLDGKTARLILPLVWELPGTARAEINGNDVELHSAQPGMQEQEIAIPVQSDGRIRIRFSEIDARLHLVLDHQRRYGRTRLDNQDPQAELVVFLCLEPNPKEPAAPSP
jgi:hypothetical protein